MNEDLEKTYCPGCSILLVEPYIRCMECAQPSVDLCLHCFARGLCIGKHESDHRYTIVKNDFPTFCNDWTAAEELKLLDAVAECGIGNWADVAQLVQTKSRVSCEEHYIKYYLENPSCVFSASPEADQRIYPCPVPYRVCEDPPRPAEGSPLQTEMAGYMPARGDFLVEYDNYAEMDLKDIAFTDADSDHHRGMKFAAVDIYRNILKERHRRKRIIRECGIINIKKILVYNRKYHNTLGTAVMDRLQVFQQLLPQEEWDALLESMHYAMKLRQSTRKLQELRSAGITTFAAAEIYERLKARRQENLGQRQLLTDVLDHMEDKNGCLHWLRRQAALDKMTKGEIISVPTTVVRRSSLPLDIVGLPGYERLTEKEKEVCSNVRVVPEAFLEFKELLSTECRKHGSLRLAQARNMIKIDVNKTRKIYDFLIDEGVIFKDSQAI